MAEVGVPVEKRVDRTEIGDCPANPEDDAKRQEDEPCHTVAEAAWGRPAPAGEAARVDPADQLAVELPWSIHVTSAGDPARRCNCRPHLRMPARAPRPPEGPIPFRSVRRGPR